MRRTVMTRQRGGVLNPRSRANPTGEPVGLYVLPSFTLQDDTAALTSQLNGASANATVNVTSKTVYACPSALPTHLMATGVNVVGNSDATRRTIVCGHIIAPSCIFDLHASDRHYSRIPSGVRSRVKVVQLGAMGISMGVRPADNNGPNDLPEKSTTDPVPVVLNGAALSICEDTPGLRGWRVVSGVGSDVQRIVTSMTRINGSGAFVAPASVGSSWAHLAYCYYDTRMMRVSSYTSSGATLTSAATGLRNGTLNDCRIKFLNAPEWLDADGEMFMDFEHGRLYYVPRTGESHTRLSVGVPYGEPQGNNRAGRIFNWGGSGSQGLDLTTARNNTVSGFDFEAAYAAPVELGVGCTANSLKGFGLRYGLVHVLNPKGVTTSNCEAYDCYREGIRVSDTREALWTYTTPATGGRNVSVAVRRSYLVADDAACSISTNRVERASTYWRSTPGVAVRGFGVNVTSNTIIDTGGPGLEMYDKSYGVVTSNIFQRCLRSITEKGALYTGRDAFSKWVIQDNRFYEINAVRSGEEPAAAIMLDDWMWSVNVLENLFHTCDMALLTNGGQDIAFTNNRFHACTTVWQRGRPRIWGAANSANWTTSSVRGQIIPQLLAMYDTTIGTPRDGNTAAPAAINYNEHPVYYDNVSDGLTVIGDLSQTLGGIVDALTGATDGRLTTAAITMGFETAVSASGLLLANNSVVMRYDTGDFTGGSAIPSFTATDTDTGYSLVDDSATLTPKFPVLPSPPYTLGG